MNEEQWKDVDDVLRLIRRELTEVKKEFNIKELKDDPNFIKFVDEFAEAITPLMLVAFRKMLKEEYGLEPKSVMYHSMPPYR